MLAVKPKFDGFTGTAFGVVLGSALRYVTIAAWPRPLPNLLTTLVFTTLCCLVLGLIASSDMLARWRHVAYCFVGAAGSVSLLGVLVITAPPVYALYYVVLVPISGLIGISGGLGIGMTTKRPEKSVVGNT